LPQLKIDILSDPACPWCLIGLARLNKAVAALADDVEVSITHHPYLLDAGAPLEGEDLVEMLTRKYGRDPEEGFNRLDEQARLSGIPLDIRKQKTRYASQPAQSLIATAAAKGTQHALACAIGDAYYLEARNIADPDVLAEIAVNHGFTDEEARAVALDKNFWTEVEKAAAQASQQGIQGVPFFIFQQKFALSGAQPEEVFTGAIDEAMKPENQPA